MHLYLERIMLLFSHSNGSAMLHMAITVAAALDCNCPAYGSMQVTNRRAMRAF